MIDEPFDPDEFDDLTGQKFQVDDVQVEVVQQKRRDDGYWVTYHVYDGPGIPRKLCCHIVEFLDDFGNFLDL